MICDDDENNRDDEEDDEFRGFSNKEQVEKMFNSDLSDVWYSKYFIWLADVDTRNECSKCVRFISTMTIKVKELITYNKSSITFENN